VLEAQAGQGLVLSRSKRQLEIGVLTMAFGNYITANAIITKRHAEASVLLITDWDQAAQTGDTLADAIARDANIQVRIDEAIADAEGLINSYLRKQYAVPIASPPDMVIRWTVDICLFNLYELRSEHYKPPEQIVSRFNRAMKELELVNTASIDLGIQPVPAASDAVVADTDSEDRLFTADTLEDF
jgi:phage gp36-like protein